MTENDLQKGAVLMYGRDQTLLDLRGMVLEKSGLSLQTVINKSALHSCLEQSAPPIAALILCHTVPEAERSLLHSLAGRKQTPVFQIEGFIAPADLIAAVSRLAMEHGSTETL